MSAGGFSDMILRSIGRFRAAFRLQVVRFIIVKTPLVLVAAFVWGFNGILYALLLSQMIIIVIDYYSISGVLHLRITEVINVLKGPILGAILMSVFFFLILRIDADFGLLILAVIGIIGAIIYALVIYSIHKFTNALEPLKSIYRPN
jgi:hypothetical protein